jgi:hypothetical protein
MVKIVFETCSNITSTGRSSRHTHPVSPHSDSILESCGRWSCCSQFLPNPQRLVALASSLHSDDTHIPRARAYPGDVRQNLLFQEINRGNCSEDAIRTLQSMLWTTRKPPGLMSAQHLSMVAKRNLTCGAVSNMILPQIR